MGQLDDEFSDKIIGSIFNQKSIVSLVFFEFDFGFQAFIFMILNESGEKTIFFLLSRLLGTKGRGSVKQLKSPLYKRPPCRQPEILPFWRILIDFNA